MFFSTLVTLLARLTGWKPPKMSKQIQHKVHYEFMGPPGAILIMTSLPIVSYALYFMCHGDKCASFNPYSKRFLSFDNPLEKGFPTMFSYEALYIFLAWMALHVLIYLYFPGQWINGVDLDGRGTRLKYKINAFLAFFVSIGVAVAASFAGWIPATYGYDHFLELLTASMIFSFGLAIYLYAASHLGTSHTPQTRLAPHGNTGNIPYDFFIGRSLNPRIGALDLKYFCELRPGLIGWVLLDLSFVAAQYKRNGEITASIVLVVLFHTIYVLDALWSEAAILTTMDITSDGFGWMLAFGDLAWVPFTYSLQARYLVDFPTHLALWQIAGILLLQLVGLYIFRTANNEKNDFRSNPNNPKFQGWYMTTERGSKLLIKGWWGRSRHPNYFGDLIMAAAWALPSGFNDAFPYFYPLYFLILLVHRQIRDDHHCHEKYGKDWDKYCELVKYRIFPYVY